VAEIERIARAHGCLHLELASSITAERFYASLSYEVVGRGDHYIAAGLPMAAVKMLKRLDGR
jgi:hypothetical protein